MLNRPFLRFWAIAAVAALLDGFHVRERLLEFLNPLVGYAAAGRLDAMEFRELGELIKAGISKRTTEEHHGEVGVVGLCLNRLQSLISNGSVRLHADTLQNDHGGILPCRSIFI